MDNETPKENCPCGNNKFYSDCCGLYIDSLNTNARVRPSTAEQLMRSRYTAYTRVNIAYLIHTTYAGSQQTPSHVSLKQWAKESNWQGLEIVGSSNGDSADHAGMVEFRAHYIQNNIDTQNNIEEVHHEKSYFIKEGGQWYFVDSPPPSRSAPCPCGSGKKHKRCCG